MKPLEVLILVAIAGGIGYGISVWRHHPSPQPALASSNMPNASNTPSRIARLENTEGGRLAGVIWMQRGDGQTLSLSLTNVYVLAERLPTASPDVSNAITKLAGDLRSAAQSQNSIFSKAEGMNENLKQLELQEANSLNTMASQTENYLSSPVVPTLAIFTQNTGYMSYKVNIHRGVNQTTGSVTSIPDVTFDTDDAWDVLVKRSLATASTDRDGRFTFDSLPAGKYAIICRTYRPANRAIVYWGVPCEITSNATTQLDMNNSNGQVMSY
jgi:hypothetical protein